MPPLITKPPLLLPSLLPPPHQDEDKNWRASINVKQILLGIQDLLTEPNNADPAQAPAYHLFQTDKAAYDKRIRAQAREMVPSD